VTGKRKRAALYLRVSKDESTVENQRLELTRVADRRGWTIVETYIDDAISGAKGRDERQGLDRLLKDASRGKFDVAMTWAVDRLGRSLRDLLDIFEHLNVCGCGIYIDQQQVDSSTPAGRAMLQMCGVFSEFERAMTIERIHAGLARAKAQGVKLGRPKVDTTTTRHVRQLLGKGHGILKVARIVGCGSGTVQRIKRELAAQE
jgi:DNA invertase Pin-like site-specific DNA recombinase